MIINLTDFEVKGVRCQFSGVSYRICSEGNRIGELKPVSDKKL
jgi:hypothetical protein